MKATDWISVKDKLPKLNEKVLVCRRLEDGSTYVDFAMRTKRQKYLHNIDIWYTEEGWDIEDVTHWQRICLPKDELKLEISDNEVMPGITEREVIQKFLHKVASHKAIMKRMNYPYDDRKSYYQNCIAFIKCIQTEGRMLELLNVIKYE